MKSDCRYFLGDRPCHFHKAEGVKCPDCRYYDPGKIRILVIKLGAMGDVLRTTSILPALRKHYEKPHVTWITRKESIDLLSNNPLVDSLVEYGADALARLQVETFNLVINPEASKESAALASMVKGKTKKGMGLSSDGYAFPFNAGAEEIFHMGLWDDLKKRNRKTYEQLVCEVSDLPYERFLPNLCLTEDEIRLGETFRREKGIRKNKPVVGINTGGGTRWLLKRWTTKGFTKLIEKLSKRGDTQILLLGGPTEAEMNRDLSAQFSQEVIDTGCFNPVRRFAALVHLCDVLVTGDSLALHIGLALRKRMVVLLGPTSEAEVDLYELGRKITADLDCLCCYRQVCNKHPNCMESISVETVAQAIKEQTGFLTS